MTDRTTPAPANLPSERTWPPGRVKVALRIRSNDLDPTDLTARLGVSPSFAARHGDVTQRSDGPHVRRGGVWLYKMDATEGWDLDSAITQLLVSLPADTELWADLQSRFRLDVFCGLFMGTDNHYAELRPSTIRLLGERGIALTLDVYESPGAAAA